MNTKWLSCILIIISSLPSVSNGSENDPSHDHDEHGYTNKHKPVGAKSIPGKLFSVTDTVVNAHYASSTYPDRRHIRLCSRTTWRYRAFKFSIERALAALS